MEFHELANLFPLIGDEELTALALDIRLNGQRESIVLFEGKILDGRNRFLACEKVGVKPHFVDYDGADPLSFVISLNLKRRHLSESQRSMVASKIANLPAHRPTDNPANLPTYSQSEASALLNVSERSVRSAKQVEKNGAPELVRAVENGVVSVSAAADLVYLPYAVQAEIVAMGEKEIVATANRIRKEKKETMRSVRRASMAELAALVSPSRSNYRVFNAPCLDAMQHDEGSVDFIITDPPYPKEFLHVYDDLGRVAAHCLKPGGSLLCMVGQSYLPELFAMLGEHLTYHWTIAYLVPGGQATQLFPKRVNTFWKPVLWFVKDHYEGDWIGDVTRSEINDNDKRFHHWGQSESGMSDLMARFVKPLDTVLDPFMGAGTTGVVALDLGATFIGYDLDVNAYNETVVRLDRESLSA